MKLGGSIRRRRRAGKGSSRGKWTPPGWLGGILRALRGWLVLLKDPWTLGALAALALLALLLALLPAGAVAQTPTLEPSATSEASPAPSETSATDRVAEIMAGMSRRQKVGQLFMSRVYGYRAKDPAPGAVRSTPHEWKKIGQSTRGQTVHPSRSTERDHLPPFTDKHTRIGI